MECVQEEGQVVGEMGACILWGNKTNLGSQMHANFLDSAENIEGS